MFRVLSTCDMTGPAVSNYEKKKPDGTPGLLSKKRNAILHSTERVGKPHLRRHYIKSQERATWHIGRVDVRPVCLKP